LELDTEVSIADFRNALIAKLNEISVAMPLSPVWSGRREFELENGLVEDDFELPARQIDRRTFPNLFE
jgi:hypothetical protein